MKFCRNAIAVFCLTACAYSQEALTKDMIVQMVKAGLPEDVIISKIRSESNPPRLSTDDLISLKSAGASDGVIRALVSPSPGKPVQSASGLESAASTDTDDPMAPHDPGVYLMIPSRDGTKRKMMLIERAGSGRNKTSNVWGAAFSYGISKAKVKAELPGPRAVTRSTEARPEFYMYFPPTGNLGATDTISSPAQFSLLELEDKKDHRETTIAKMGLGSASAGNDEKKTFKFDAEKIRAYAYKVTPDASLRSGEYAFVASSGMAGGASAAAVVVFDFGVDLK